MDISIISFHCLLEAHKLLLYSRGWFISLAHQPFSELYTQERERDYIYLFVWRVCVYTHMPSREISSYRVEILAL